MMRRIGTITTMVGLAILASPMLAMAQEAAGGGAGGTALRAGLIALAANIGVGIAAFGSGLGQGRMVAAAMESIGRNPNSSGQIFTPMLLGLAFIEALTLYALVIAFLLQAKI
ncbi:MAG TPA: ATP synthase F0 subunit C [Candidatus Binataceae bacterium]|jgi:F-type H+-transporting ATPase subunit c